MVVVSFLYLYICMCVCVCVCVCVYCWSQPHTSWDHPIVLSFTSTLYLLLLLFGRWLTSDPPGDDSLPRGRWLHWLRCVVCCRAEHLQRDYPSPYLSPLCLCTQHLSALLSLRVCLYLKRLECWFLRTNALNIWGLCEIKKHIHFYTVKRGLPGDCLSV